MFDKKTGLLSVMVATVLWLCCFGLGLTGMELNLIETGETAILSAEQQFPGFLNAAQTTAAGELIKDYEIRRLKEVRLSERLTARGMVQTGEKVGLNLFPDKSYEGMVDRVNLNINGTYTVRVRITGYPFAYMLMSTTAGRTLATISIPELQEFYLIKSDPQSFRHYLLDIGEENRRHLESGPPLIAPGDERENRSIDNERDERDGQTERNPGPDDPAIIDVMIVYTPAAEAWADVNGGGIDNVIAQTVETSQLVYDNSETIMRMHLAHSALVDYEESGNSGTDLMRLTFREDWDPWGQEGGPPWYLEEVHEWRDEYGADLVAILALVNDVGGVGWQLSRTQGYPELGFTLTRVQQAARSYTFVHELGHNMGAHHHRAQNFQPGPGLYNYSAGWRWSDGDNNRYCTVMTYTSGQYFEDGLNHAHIPFFSNPAIAFEEIPTGHAMLGDNARTLKNTKHVIAGYRERVMIVEDYPWVESFENVLFPPDGWRMGNVAGDTRWERTAGGNEDNPDGAADGEFNALFYAEQNHSGYLIIPELDLSQTVNNRLSFYHSQAQRNGNQDILDVYYSNSITGEWTRLARYAENTPGWTLRTIDLPTVFGSLFIKFEALSANGYGVAIDNVRIEAEPLTNYPLAAFSPQPADSSIGNPVELASLSWGYEADTLFAEPAGFRVYFNNTGEFEEDDDFGWVVYDAEEERFEISDFLPQLQIGRRYYWQVVPTTREPEGRSGRADRRVKETGRNTLSEMEQLRNDAYNCPVWTFWTTGPAVTVSGRVLGNDAPGGLEEVSVFLANVNDTFRVETDAEGRFLFEEIEGSLDGLPYRLTVSRRGYQTHRGNVIIRGQALNLGNIVINEKAWLPRDLTAELREDDRAVVLEWLEPLPEERGRDHNLRTRRDTGGRESISAKYRELEGYRIFRYNITDEDDFDRWDLLASLVWTTFTDLQWTELEPERFRYAVQAVYTGDLFSDFIFSAAVSNEFQGGKGSEDRPWLISTAGQLNRVRNYEGNQHSDKYFRQITNIDFEGTAWSEGEGWLPIGTSAAQFMANYDGDRYSVLSMMINRPELNNVGLFGFCRNATLQNISIVAADIMGGRWVGGIVGDITGTADQPGRVVNCFVSGNITGLDRVGGIAGYVLRSTIENSYAAAHITGLNTGEIGAGGITGFLTTGSTISNCFSAGTVSAENDGTHTAGLAGKTSAATIINSYALARVNGERTAGGLTGERTNTQITNSYWDIETTRQEESAGGEGRTTAEMTFPYDEDTFVEWDFENIWMEDEAADMNAGYPYLRSFYSNHPTVATNPLPANRAIEVSINLEELHWSYESLPTYASPLGFRVYCNDSGQFGDEDGYVWIEYEEGQEEYSTAAILPDQLDYYSVYFWKVVPTTIAPEERREADIKRDARRFYQEQRDALRNTRGDARSIPVWTFRTERHPNPDIASNPVPANDSVNVAIALGSLQWKYPENPAHLNPAGFKLYFNETGDFNAEEFQWVPYLAGVEDYSDIITGGLDYQTKYYWQVIPTTETPVRRAANDTRDRKSRRTRGTRMTSPIRGDAQNCPVWTFTTVTGAAVDEDALPVVTALQQNYPNPFNPETFIRFSLSDEMIVELVIYNLRGQVVSTLQDGLLQQGRHQAVWNGTDDTGKKVGSGIYFYRMKAGDVYEQVNKMLLVK